jgi:uncharacterized phiE125 gp8 family phage protein
MDLQIKTGPTKTSITTDFVKANKRILSSKEDDLIEFWINVADKYIEDVTNRCMMQQTLVLTVQRVLPEIQLPRPPFDSFVSIKYTRDGVETTVPHVDLKPRMVNMLPTFAIPGITCSVPGSVSIEYVAGANAEEDVPFPLRQAALLLASHYTTSREAAFMDPRLTQVDKKIEYGVDQLVGNYRIPNIDALLNGGY